MFSIHHLTHIKNLKNILLFGLKSRNILKNENDDFTDTAENDIIIKRKELNNYIPFHFNFIQERYGIPYNYSVCKREKPENIIFLVATTVRDESKSFIFNLYHPISTYTKNISNFPLFEEKFFEEIENYSNELGILKYSDQEVKNLFMSELLIKSSAISIDDRWEIYVYSQNVKNKIENLFEDIIESKLAFPEIIVDDKKIFFRNL